MSTVTTHVSEQVGNLSIAELESLIRPLHILPPVLRQKAVILWILPTL